MGVVSYINLKYLIFFLLVRHACPSIISSNYTSKQSNSGVEKNPPNTEILQAQQ